MSNTLTTSELAFLDIYEQYVDEASFLWLMHTIAVDQPHYGVKELHNLENRIESQLNGLMGNLDIAWTVCEQRIEDDAESGEIFTAAILAFRSHDQTKVQMVVEAAMLSEEGYQGLLYALTWLPGNLVHDWIKRFFTSKDLNHKKLAIQVCNIRRENPADYLVSILQRDDCLEKIDLYIAALKIAGELKRFDLLEHLLKAIEHDDEAVKFWAIRSAIFIGDKAQVVKLEPYISKSSELQHEAIEIAFRVLPIATARQWVAKLVDDPEQIRTLIIITGVIGDPFAIDWLLQKMHETEFARVAAEAFSLITGTNLINMDMANQPPEDADSLPNEDPDDENVKMHDDENLPWPNVIKVQSYWNSIKSNYIAGQRYLLGNHIGLLFLKNNLESALQRQRHAIAIEISLIDKNEKLFNTRGKVS